MKVDKKMDTSLKTDATAGARSSKLDSSRKSKASDILAPDVNLSARVDLSEKAQNSKKAGEIARKGLNDVDEAKVAKFQALIDSGKYSVDAAKVADKMVDEHLANEFAARDAKN